MTKAYLEAVATNITTSINAVAAQMAAFMATVTNQANTNANVVRQDRENEQRRIPQGGHRHRAVTMGDSSSDEGDAGDDILVDSEQRGHDYRVRADIPFFHGNMSMEEFLD